jgi:hypothetical protein
MGHGSTPSDPWPIWPISFRRPLWPMTRDPLTHCQLWCKFSRSSVKSCWLSERPNFQRFHNNYSRVVPTAVLQLCSAPSEAELILYWMYRAIDFCKKILSSLSSSRTWMNRPCSFITFSDKLALNANAASYSAHRFITSWNVNCR